MKTFTLDTSGIVPVPVTGQDGYAKRITWPDLDAFTQGSGEAMARDLYKRLLSEGSTPEDAAKAVAFHNWAPGTLARIIATSDLALGLGAPNTVEAGARHWAIEQANSVSPFPPLVLYLGDDGKVHLREAA